MELTRTEKKDINVLIAIIKNNPMTPIEEINKSFEIWKKQGRTDEQIWAVQNFLTGAGEKGIQSAFEKIKKESYKEGKKDRESIYAIPCSDGNHNSFWKSVVESPEWKEWEKEVARRFSIGRHNEKGNWTGPPVFDVDECREVGWISNKHFAEFLNFCRGQAI